MISNPAGSQDSVSLHAADEEEEPGEKGVNSGKREEGGGGRRYRRIRRNTFSPLRLRPKRTELVERANLACNEDEKRKRRLNARLRFCGSFR